MYHPVFHPKRRGMILYVVAVVLVLLALAAYALTSLLTVEHEATVLSGDEIQIMQVARSGVDYVAVTIASTTAAPSTEFGSPSPAGVVDPFADIATDPFAPPSPAPRTVSATDLYDNRRLFVAVPVVPRRPNRPKRGTARFTAIAPRFEEERLVGVRYGLIDESARLHLGTVLTWDAAAPGQGARSLMKLPGMTPSTADSILDWIDADKSPRSSGAEVDYYERAGLPYAPRNTLPVSLEELLLVRDVTRELVYGEDEAFTFGFQRTGPRKEIAEVPPWSYLLTTLSAEKLVDPTTGFGKIDLNGEDLDGLHALLERRLGQEIADFVVLYRRGTSADGTPAVPRRIACPIDLLDMELAEPDVLDSGTSARPPTVPRVDVRMVKSPFSLDKGEAEARFLDLLDAATEEKRLVIPGRININEAPRCVLAAIPGVEESVASRIVARRGPPGEGREARLRHPCWLLSEAIVDAETLRAIWPWITTGGDVWRTQIVAFYDGEGPAERLEAVLDATVKPPRQVFLKDLTLYGSGYPHGVLMGEMSDR